MQGNKWNTLKENGSGCPPGGFEENESYSASSWSDPFDYIPQYDEEGMIYPTYDITLHAVRNGNFQTKSSSANEFFKR
ncbi:MAG: hypothetical protein HDS97_07230 [Bacteroidales bacterium]|nr:hypothetical protein [Bacteroidales bacterium]